VSETHRIDSSHQHDPLTESLRPTLARWLAALAARPAGGLASYTVPVGRAIGPGCPVPSSGYAWSRPSRHHDLAGAGVAAIATAAGEQRFETLTEAHRRWLADWSTDGAAEAPDGRIAFAGFCFNPLETPGPDWHGLANAQLTVPAVLLQRRHGRAWLTFNVAAGPAAGGSVDAGTLLELADGLLERSHHQIPARDTTPVILEPRAVPAGDGDDPWRRRLDEALADIERGRVQKLVLTRRVRYASSRPVDCRRVFRALEAEHPECAGYAVTLPGFALLGVSPERLVSIEGDTVTVDALAGTAPRHPDPSADATLARRMLDDPKIREEHRLVRDRIVEAIAPTCTDVVAPSSPALMRLPRVQHLWSPIRGHLRAGQNLLTLAARLHPTPAVGGSPVDRAIAWLAEREADRGWYTGACGWLDADGGGELVVVLRCGVINDRTVDLFAGAGIVAGSEPERELAETDWKLMTMRGALRFG
jgi:menaquinone-specific isochorismate synthase